MPPLKLLLHPLVLQLEIKSDNWRCANSHYCSFSLTLTVLHTVKSDSTCAVSNAMTAKLSFDYPVMVTPQGSDVDHWHIPADTTGKRRIVGLLTSADITV